MIPIRHCEEPRRGRRSNPGTGIASPRFAWLVVKVLLLAAGTAAHGIFASEVMEETKTVVVVREHPKTGGPYVVITLPEKKGIDPLLRLRGRLSRPDYRLLDPKLKAGKIPYEGPVSDRKKVYLFAAGIAAAGTASGALVIASAPAATGAAASGGAGAYLAGGAAVATGSAAAAAGVVKGDSKKDNYKLRSESRLAKEKKEGEI